MWNPLVNLEGFRVTFFNLALAVGFGVSSFVIWRKMREDYAEEEIVSLAIWLAALGWLGSGVWMWWTSVRLVLGGVTAAVVGLVWWCRRHGWNTWEWLDVVGPVSLGVAVLAAIGWGPAGWQVAVAGLLGLVISGWLKRGYRHLSWYKSGRVGFVGCVSLGWWGVMQLVVANFNLWGVYSLSWILVTCAVALYLRGGRKVTEDFEGIWRKIHLPRR